jgi:hypothetical protein
LPAPQLNTRQAKLVYKVLSAIQDIVAKSEPTPELVMLNALLVNTDDLAKIIDLDIEAQKKIDIIMSMAKQEIADYERTA